MNNTKSTIKCILIGGIASGLISLIPIINFLNLFFMMLMGLGGALSVYLLIKENKNIKTSDALLTGLLSGFVGGFILGIFMYIVLSNITPEKIENIISTAKIFSSSIEDEMDMLFQNGNLKIMARKIIAFLIFFSMISGAIGGFISKSLFQKKDG